MIQENKHIVRTLVEELEGTGNYAAAKTLLATDFGGKIPFFEIDGRHEYISSVQMLRSAFPDMDVQVTQLVAEDDMVAIRLAVRGTQQGEFLGLSPTGRPIQMNGAAFFRVAGGKIVEAWSFPDLFGVMQQLGAIPEQEAIS
ncbi:MAG: ester cyclase [Candidatus Promineifilaceae bacterium]|jgi:steroid delta-isomerase-like uncharacterized protein